MTDLFRVERAASLRHQLGLETSDRPAGLPGTDLTVLLRLVSDRGDGESLAGERPLPDLAVLSTQPHWQSLAVRPQHGGQTAGTAALRPADPLVVETAAGLVRGGEGLHTSRGVVQLLSQPSQGVVLGVSCLSPDPLHH